MPTSLYVGIDLGTTFTGVVYACPPLRTIHTISEWPGTDNNEAKVPTRLFYDNNKLVGWGFAHPGHDTKGKKGRGQEISVVERFKLAIDPALSVSPDTVRPMPSSVSKWYKDFLKCLYEHISFLLQALQPQAWSQEVEFMFSIPNLYGPHIIAKFRDFIQSAGFDGGRHHVSIVSLTESQAAIVYASHSLSVFKNDDLVLVCDAGGGTTDCSLLRIVHQDGGRLQMEEVSPAFGMQVGSTKINSAMKNYYVAWLRQHFQLEYQPQFDHLVDREIENYKVSFTSYTHAPLVLRATGYPDVQVSSLDVKRSFDSCVADIFLGINTEMRSLSSTGIFQAGSLYVVLCGGLGSSQYVRSAIINLLASKNSAIPHARVTRIQDPQLVVARGLVAEKMWRSAETREIWMGDKAPWESFAQHRKSLPMRSLGPKPTPTSLFPPQIPPKPPSYGGTSYGVQSPQSPGRRNEVFYRESVSVQMSPQTAHVTADRDSALRPYRAYQPPLKTAASLVERANYQFEADDEDNEIEDDIDDNLEQATGAAKRLILLARATGSEIEAHNQHLLKSHRIDDRLAVSQGRRKPYEQFEGSEAAKSSFSPEQDIELPSGSYQSAGLSGTATPALPISGNDHDEIAIADYARKPTKVRRTQEADLGADLPPDYSLPSQIAYEMDVSTQPRAPLSYQDAYSAHFPDSANFGNSESGEDATIDIITSGSGTAGIEDPGSLSLVRPAVLPDTTGSSHQAYFGKSSPPSETVGHHQYVQRKSYTAGQIPKIEPSIPSTLGALPHGSEDSDIVFDSVSCETYGISDDEEHPHPSMGAFAQSLALPEMPTSSHQRRNKTSTPQSSNKCNECKLRSSNCDERFPRCGNCILYNLTCVKSPQVSPQAPAPVYREDKLKPSNSRSSPLRVPAKVVEAVKTQQAPPKSIFCKRRCRVSYGVLKLELYDESKHLRQDVWRFPLNNKLYVENIIEWVIKQGDEIDDVWTARFLCQKMLSHSESDDKKYIFQTHLVTSNKKVHQLPKSMTQGGAAALCNIEADLSRFPLSEFEKHVHKLGMFKKSRIFYLVKYHVAASSSPADIIFEVLFKGKAADHRVERRVLWHDISQAAPATLTPDVGSFSLGTTAKLRNAK